MPIIKSEYRSPSYLISGHLQTILPALFRRVGNIFYERERITTPDDDFLDLDWSKVNSQNIVIISHGLEGNSKAPYVLGMVRALNKNGLDVLAWNYRGCSEEINKQHRFYHSGETGDLNFIIQHVISLNKYKNIALIGFSIGGNITLKYLGEKKEDLSKNIKCAVTLSVPCHLASGAMHLGKWQSKIYMNRFLKSLRSKVRAKAALMPELINDKDFHTIKNFLQFDERYTAPIHGFKNAHDYWEKNSSLYFIKDITLPTLILTAQNDPFLSKECYPIKEAAGNDQVYLEMPANGGHCGFYKKGELYWSEKRALEFIKHYFKS